MARHKRHDWNLPELSLTWDHAHMAVLMDIRDELENLNRLFRCQNFLGIPASLQRLELNTRKRKRKTRAK
jgi:hypothetical protein